MQRTRTGGGAYFSRKEFLRLGGAGLAGAALFGAAGCGGGGEGGGNELIFSWGEDDPGVLPGLIEKFNKQN
jgi:multiple sugar transport system substrate-binding protein